MKVPFVFSHDLLSQRPVWSQEELGLPVDMCVRWTSGRVRLACVACSPWYDHMKISAEKCSRAPKPTCTHQRNSRHGSGPASPGAQCLRVLPACVPIRRSGETDIPMEATREKDDRVEQETRQQVQSNVLDEAHQTAKVERELNPDAAAPVEASSSGWRVEE